MVWGVIEGLEKRFGEELPHSYTATVRSNDPGSKLEGLENYIDAELENLDELDGKYEIELEVWEGVDTLDYAEMKNLGSTEIPKDLGKIRLEASNREIIDEAISSFETTTEYEFRSSTSYNGSFNL